MKAFDKKSDKSLGKRTTDAGITTASAGLDAIAGGIPVFAGIWLLCKALLGNAMALRQDRVREWVEVIQDNSGIFREESRDRYATPESDINPRIIFHDIRDYTDYGKGFASFLKQTP